jgi:2-dehydro-3-deoxygluconokinase
MGDRLLTQVRGRGVNCDHIRRSPSGNSLIVRNSGENRNVEVLSWRTGLAGSELDQRDITRLPSARYTLITGITAMLGSSAHKAVLELVKKQKKEHSLIVFDPNVRRSLGSQLEWKRVAGDLAAMSDIILAGTDELGLITDNQGARLLLEKGARMVIEKRGRDGATTHLKGSILEATGMPVLVVDPVGAGDAFNAGFLSGLLDEMDTLEAMQRGIKLQSLTVGHIGDTAGHPNRHVLDSTRMDIRR